MLSQMLLLPCGCILKDIPHWGFLSVWTSSMNHKNHHSPLMPTLIAQQQSIKRRAINMPQQFLINVQYKYRSFYPQASYTPFHVIMQIVEVQPKKRKVSKREIETLSLAFNEVSRAKGKPITNCTFNILRKGGEEKRAREPWSLSSEINWIYPCQENSGNKPSPSKLRFLHHEGKKFKIYGSNFIWVFQEVLADFLAHSRKIPQEQCKEQ